MILLNFGQKMNKTSFDQIKALTGKTVTEQVMLPLESAALDEFLLLLEKAYQKVKLTPEDFSSDRIVVNPPPSAHLTAIISADLLSRTGSLPYLVRTRRDVFSLAAHVDIQEVIDLQIISSRQR